MNKIALILMSLWSVSIYASEGRDTLSISFESEGHTLRGRLLLPKERQNPVPLVVFLVGSGGNSSYATDYRRFLEFFLLQPFAGEEMAFLFFDKRGVAESEGKWHKTDFYQRALDAKQAVEAVKDHEAVDATKVYVVGHSQGGWIVQICLAEYPNVFAGGISMAGPTFGVKKQLINDYQSNFICNENLLPSEALKKASRRVNRDLTVISLIPAEENWKQLKVIRKFDPERHLQSIDRPLLLMFAENDRLVNPGWSMEHLETLFPTGIPSWIKTYTAPGENHQFQVSPLCYTGSWNDLTYSAATRDVMAKWLTAQMKAH